MLFVAAYDTVKLRKGVGKGEEMINVYSVV
jgi:hypothetical protein